MHIYDKQCGIMQQNQWKGPNFQIHCILDMARYMDNTILNTIVNSAVLPDFFLDFFSQEA